MTGMCANSGSSIAIEVCQEEEARFAAMDGYFVPDDEVANEEKDTSEPTVLFGDNEKLTAKQVQVVLSLKDIRGSPP